MRTSTYSRNIQLDSFGALANNGFLRIYSGPSPASSDDPVPKSSKLISEHRFSSNAFKSAFSGSIKSNPISDDVDARVSANAEWFRVTKSDGATVIYDGSVGKTGCDLNLSSTTIQARSRVTIDELIVIQPE